MSIKAKVRTTSDRIVAKTVKIQAGELSLGDLVDVNTAGQSDGAMVVYDGTRGEFKVTTDISNENLNITGGTY